MTGHRDQAHRPAPAVKVTESGEIGADEAGKASAADGAGVADGAPMSDPYGMGPGARISVGGHFPPGSPRPQDQEWIDTTTADHDHPGEGDGRGYAVALVAMSWTEHAVPWARAVAKSGAVAVCGTPVTVADISGSRVIWTPGPIMCRHCAQTVTGDPKEQEGQGR